MVLPLAYTLGTKPPEMIQELAYESKVAIKSVSVDNEDVEKTKEGIISQLIVS